MLRPLKEVEAEFDSGISVATSKELKLDFEPFNDTNNIYAKGMTPNYDFYNQVGEREFDPDAEPPKGDYKGWYPEPKYKYVNENYTKWFDIE